jgi:hypothetical protein
MFYKDKVVLGAPEGYGKSFDDHMEMVGKEINRVTPILAVLCCRTLLKYLLQQRYRDVIGPLLKYLLQPGYRDVVGPL